MAYAMVCKEEKEERRIRDTAEGEGRGETDEERVI